MSTSLKVQYADEIMEAMAAALGDKDLMKEASLTKEAGPVLDKFVAAVNAPGTKGDDAKIDALWNQYLDSLQAEENKYAGTIQKATEAREAAKGGPGSTVPQLGEDGECFECPDKMPSDNDNPEPAAWDGQHMAAAEFAMNHVAKIADLLDNKGFEKIADILDETLEKLASKKSK